MLVNDDAYMSKKEMERSEAFSVILSEKGIETNRRFNNTWDGYALLSTCLQGWLFNDETLKAYNKSMCMR